MDLFTRNSPYYYLLKYLLFLLKHSVYLKLSDLCSLSETVKIILEWNNYTLKYNLSITTKGENVMQIIPNAIQKPMVVKLVPCTASSQTYNLKRSYIFCNSLFVLSPCDSLSHLGRKSNPGSPEYKALLLITRVTAY